MLYKAEYFHHQGIKLHYFIVGEGKPLLFLPGGLRVSTYLQNIHFLSQYYKVIALDLPGFGKSSTPEEVWSLELYAEFISAFVDSLHIRSLDAVGHSYGGGVGLYLAMLNRRVKRLVVYSPMGVESSHNPVVFYFNILVTKTVNDALAMKTNIMRTFVFNKALSTVTENISNLKMMLRITNKVLYKHTPPEQLQKIQIPVKLLWGRKDELFSISNGHYLQKHIKNSTLEELDGNHDWWTVHPMEGVKKIREFLERKERKNG